MANDREPIARESSSAARKSPPSKPAVGSQISSGGKPFGTSGDRKPVSTSEPTVTTARNATIRGNAVISSEAIRARAYELYEQRGRHEGFHEQDWHEAESQLRNRKDRSLSDQR